MNLREETIRNMELLGEYSRTGIRQNLSGITPGRIHHYRRLVTNVVNDTLRTAFPITVAALGEDAWQELVDEFFSEGFPRTPQVWKMPFEFYQYHAERETRSRNSLLFLDDLLYFEWMEIEIHTMPDRPYPDFVSEGDLFKDRLAFNPEYEIVRLEYPVHTHPVSEAIYMKGDYFALLYRMPESGHVQFLNISALNVYIITRLQEEKVAPGELTNEFARVAGIESGKYLEEALKLFLGDLLGRKMILGYLRN